MSGTEHLTKKEIQRILFDRIDMLVKHLKSHGCDHSEIDLLKERSLDLYAGHHQLPDVHEQQVPDTTIPLLQAILLELRGMRRQERDYWETWRQAKAKETEKK